MSEKQRHHVEVSSNSAEQAGHNEHIHAHEKQHDHAKERHAEKQTKSLEEIRRTVEQSAIHTEQVRNEERAALEQDTSPLLVQKELKNITFKKTLKNVQKKLPATERTFSKVVHSPIVDKISAVGEKTVARPIGILGGGALALLGSIFATYFSRRFGMSYNIFMFVIFFTVGYALTTIFELIYRGFVKSRNS